MKAQLARLIPAVLVLGVLNAAAVTRYLDLNSPGPTVPFTSWPTAATNIQDAIDAAVDGDQVLVTNGVYQTGGRTVFGLLTNRVVINKAVTVQSVNGPDLTLIKGFQVPGTLTGDSAVRCVYLTSGASLIGFTITNGATRSTGDQVLERNGGGVWCESGSAILSNCVLVANAAARYAGGVYFGTLNSCIIISNRSLGSSVGGAGGSCLGTLNNCLLIGNQNNGGLGGGALSNVLNDCVLVGNFTVFGGGGAGASYSTLNGCLLTNNSSAASGGGAAFCSLTNCTIVNNLAVASGGGAYFSSLSLCFVSNNRATNSGGGGLFNSMAVRSVISSNWSKLDAGGAFGSTLVDCSLLSNFSLFGKGGGAYGGNLTNCLLYGNRAAEGGGAYQGILHNCTIAGNSATNLGGGIYLSTARNSIVYYNAAPVGSNQYNLNTYLTYSCTSGPVTGTGNVTNKPLFVDQASGNFQLASNSPCINSGWNLYAPAGVDLDGNPRIVGGTVDIGSYEFQSPASVLSYAWAQQYGLPTDGSADFTDPDADDMNNYGEWRSDTIPTNALSVLRLVSATNSAGGAKVTWQSVATRSYWVERATNLGSVPPFSTIASNLTGAAGTKTYTDPSATNAGPYFYRVGVQ